MVLACVIPYRDSRRQWEHFCGNTLPLLRDCGVQVIVVEQTRDGKAFNRGALLNAAVRELLCDADEMLTHDVDVHPTRDTIERFYLPPLAEGDVRGMYTFQCDGASPLIKIRVADFRRSGGLPCHVFGWGVEDGVFALRAKRSGLRVSEHLPPPNDRFAPTPAARRRSAHEVDGRAPIVQQGILQRAGGYESTRYAVKSCLHLRRGVTWLTVELP